VKVIEIFGKLADKVARATGHPITFVGFCLVITVWATTGPLFGYSDTWQLIVNTGTTTVTFLIVFLIQNTQNRDGAAFQAKLDELIRSSAAHNTFIGIDHLDQDEVEKFRNLCAMRAAEAKRPTKKRGRIGAERAESHPPDR
jgi:low affinity Fe/Cu permease